MESLRLENTPIAYGLDDTAGGDWIVFVHAAFVDRRMFEKQFRAFSGKYNLLAVDLLGHGESSGVRKGDSIVQMSEWIDRIFRKHGIAAAHLVGVSLGAVIIQDFADKYADKVLSLACFGGYDIHRFDRDKQKKNAKGQMKMVLKALISIKWFACSNKKISAYTAEAQEEFYRLNLRFKKRSLAVMSKLQALVNARPAPPRRYRLLVGCGEHDIPMELDIVREWAAREGCAEVILPGAGHCANMDRPNEFNECLETFWKGE